MGQIDCGAVDPLSVAYYMTRLSYQREMQIQKCFFSYRSTTSFFRGDGWCNDAYGGTRCTGRGRHGEGCISGGFLC